MKKPQNQKPENEKITLKDVLSWVIPIIGAIFATVIAQIILTKLL